VSGIGRFYNTASVVEAEGGFGVMLDERQLRTPARTIFAAPTQALAEAIAAEWAAQGDQIAPLTMPLTRLAFTAIDRTPGLRREIVAEIGRYLETDLICHRASAPDALVAAQARAWDPWIDWAADRLGARLTLARGVVAAAQPAEAGATLRIIAEAMDDFRLTAFADACGGLGSCVLGLALCEGALSVADAYTAATIDEAYQLQLWGEDEEARARLEALAAQIAALGEFVGALPRH
jgi:chaperone required for assembly of F1-ATPase